MGAEADTEGAGVSSSSTTAPLDPELWQLTRAAVIAAGDAADRELADGGWRPRVSLPSVGTFDSGWPNLSRSRLFPRDDAPTDYSALFGPKREQLKPLAYSDVPELTALLSYVRGRIDLTRRLSMPSARREDIHERMLEFEVMDLPLSILDRARALGLLGDDELLGVYLERERAWLVDPLPVEYLFPLVLTALELNDGFEIDAKTRIERLDEPTQAARAPADFSISSVPDTVIAAATHALVVSGSALPQSGSWPTLVRSRE